ncbi:MAG: hypothetical protein ACFFD1_00915 [Candidatus Thorarchaeota archaeon]
MEEVKYGGIMDKYFWLNILIFFAVIIIIISITFLILQHCNPIKECEDKPDDYIPSFSNIDIPCGELRAINVSYGKII